jgi:hypothetical protein
MQFQDTPNPLQKAQFLAKTITPLLKSTTKVLSGSKNKDWTHGYAIAVEGMKGIMKEIVTEPNVLLVQELSSKAVPVPRKAKLTLDSIPVNLHVV